MLSSSTALTMAMAVFAAIGGTARAEPLPSLTVEAPLPGGQTHTVIATETYDQIKVGIQDGFSGIVSVGPDQALVSNGAVLGQAGTAQGKVYIGGTGGQWTDTGTVHVGMLGTGGIDIGAADRFQSNDVLLGSFGSGKGTVTVDGGLATWSNAGLIAVGEFGSGRIDILNGGSLATDRISIGGNLDNPSVGGTGTVTVSGANSTLVVNSALAVGAGGSGSLVVSNGGVVDVESAGISGVGTLSIAGEAGSTGTLYIGSGPDELPAAAGTIKATNITFGAGSGSLVLDHSSSAYELASNISGNGSVNVLAGTTTLSGLNSYTGSTIIRGGVLEIVSQANLGSGAIEIGGGNNGTATLRFGADANFSRDLYLSSNSAVLDTAGNNVAVSGIVSGVPLVSLHKDGAGTLSLTGANTYQGRTFVDAGTLVAGIGNLGTGIVLAADGATFVLDQAIDGTFENEVQGAGGFVKRGAGNVVLSGGNTVTGATSIEEGGVTTSVTGGLGAGTVTIASGASAAYAGDASTEMVAITNHGTLAFFGNATGARATVTNDSSGSVTIAGLTASGTSIGSLSGAGAIDLGANSLTVGGLGADDTISGAISGTSALIKTGSGRLTLTGFSSYTGGTRVDSGTLALGNAMALGTGGVTLAADTTLDYIGNDAFTASLTLDGDARLNVDAGLSVDQVGMVTGLGGIDKTGAGELNIWSTASYEGSTLISGGRLVLHGLDAISDGSAVTVGTGATLALSSDFYGNGETIGSLAGAGTVDLGSRELTTGGNNQSTTFSGTIAGDASGALVKTGTGILTLTGDQTYTGSTYVTGGILDVKGQLASNYVNVSSTGALGGSGFLSGEVTVGNGGRLLGSSGQTLTMAGLVMDAGSAIDVRLGAPGTTSLFNVNGDVRLNGGTVNVDSSLSTILDPGIYRLIDYSGTLYNSGGLTLGSVPVGMSANDLAIQTAAVGQINLVSAQGLTLNFWDGGAPASLNNGVVDGGSGTWSATSENWTDMDGLVTMRMRPPQNMAIFQGAAGDVVVNGTVAANGMQFTVDGYSLSGGSIDLGLGATFRVGDGTDDSAGYSATIGSSITGIGGLGKTDLGTLILTGTNNYSGPTFIDAGTLVGSATSFGSGLILNAGNLVFRQTTDGSFGQEISGAGSLRKEGAGTLELAAANSYRGGTTIDAGTLKAQVAGALGTGPVSIGANSGLIFSGSTNAGLLVLTNAARPSSGNGGFIRFNDNTSAGDARVTNLTGATSEFWDNATADEAIFGNAGQVTFSGRSTAATAQITNNATGDTNFFDTASAGSATLTNAGGDTYFFDISSAGSGTLTNNDGGRIFFIGAPTADQAKIINTSGTVSIRNLTSDGIAVGSLSGAGDISLGGKNLTLGGLNGNDLISGTIVSDPDTGSLSKIGTGTLTLSGDNAAFSGSTMVSDGALNVTGALGGSVAVYSGGSLEGKGTLGGSTTVHGGGTLLGTSGATLSFASLALETDAIVSATLGVPTSQSLFDVTGDLVLNGTLNVTTTDAFGAGVYRLFDYGGELSGNGLTLGTAPESVDGDSLSIQSAIAGHINLVNTAGQDLRFWDGGGILNHDNGLIEGGAGVWDAGNRNWTNADGVVNGPMKPVPTFAVFANTGRDVTVDGSQGAVEASGMQFAATGYVLSGDAIRLADAHSNIRVGDGTDAGRDFVATISSELTGDATFVKSDLGTLILTGANSYTGGTSVEGGTLIGSASSIRGDLANAGTVIFDQADNATFAGAIRSSGALVKQGAGALTLTGANSSTGTLNIAQGTLIGSATALGNGTLINNAALVIAQDSDGHFAGGMSGTGTLLKTGAGSLTLSGDSSTYLGATTIREGGIVLTGSLASNVTIETGGVLQVGDNGLSGNLTGATANDGQLIFARADDYDYIGALSGNGSLIKRGSGSLLLSGEYSYTGSTVVEGGSVTLAAALNPATDLVVGSGKFDLSDRVQTVASLSGGGGTVALGATGQLTVNQQAPGNTFAGSLTGQGLFIKTGVGRLNLTGDSSFTGQAIVEQGRLSVNGTLKGPVEVQEQGAIGGNGTIGGLIVRTGGTAAPGNSIGLLHVDGNVTFETGSVYDVEANATVLPDGFGVSDRLVATGSAHIEGGRVNVIAEDGEYKPLTTYNILTAQNGVDGTFTGSDDNLAYLDSVLSYDGNNVYLKLIRNDVDFAAMASTFNQKSTAATVEALTAVNPIYQAAVTLTQENAGAAYDQLSGEIHASARTALVADASLPRTAVLSRLSNADGEGRGAWLKVIGNWGTNQGDGNAAAVDRDTTGFLLGLDTPAGENWTFGLVGGHTETDLTSTAGNGKVNATHILGYAGAYYGNVRIKAGFGYAWGNLDLSRSVNFGSFKDSVQARYNGDAIQGFAELGYALPLGGGALEPFTSVSVVRSKTDAFSERGGEARLSVDADDKTAASSITGVRISTPEAGSFALKAMVGWQHNYGHLAMISHSRFQDGGMFKIAGTPVSRDAGVVELEGQVQLGFGVSLGASYNGTIGSAGLDHAIAGALNIRF